MQLQPFRDERGRCDRHYRTVAETAIQTIESEQARLEDEEKQRALREQKLARVRGGRLGDAKALMRHRLARRPLAPSQSAPSLPGSVTSGRPEQRRVAIRRHLAQLAAEGERGSRREQQYREGREHGAIYLRRALAWNKPARASRAPRA